MENNVFGCWYEPGDAGTWLTWFINQHQGFPKFYKSIRYEQERKEFGNIPTDYSCMRADWDVNKPFPKVDFNQCYKILPWHNPFQTEEWELDNETPAELCVRLISESNTKAIIVPQVEDNYELFAKRLAFIRSRFTVESAIEIYKNRQDRMYESTKLQMQEFVTVHTIAIDKLILHNDKTEYHKLIEILNVPALEDWTTHTTKYYNKIFSPWKNISAEQLDSRVETINAVKENPY